MYTNVEAFCVGVQENLQGTIAQMNQNRLGIILVVDDRAHLLGTITDGDIRRAVLARIPLDAKVTVLLEKKANTLYAEPLTGRAGQDKQVYLDLLRKHRLCHLPIINEENQVIALVASDEFMPQSLASLDAVVMAGGKGSRLLPLTKDLPKPMLPLGEKPLLEIIIEKLRSEGIRQVNVTTHHKPEKIKEHFGNGEDFGVVLNYVSEDRPLGTAGALGLIEDPKQTLLVINGDILTQIDFKAMLHFHREHKADLTVGVRIYDFEVPYGVMECEGAHVVAVQEKPKYNLMVNAGIYMIEPHAQRFIPQGEHYHMTDLIQSLLEKGLNVVSFPIHEYWLDIGKHSEYRQAQEEIKELNF